MAVPVVPTIAGVWAGVRTAQGGGWEATPLVPTIAGVQTARGKRELVLPLVVPTVQIGGTPAKSAAYITPKDLFDPMIIVCSKMTNSNFHIIAITSTTEITEFNIN